MRKSHTTEDIRESILDAAHRLLRRYGYKRMTVEDIAHEAEIGKGTIYLYFASKADVALGWMERNQQRMLEELQVIAEADGTPCGRIRRMLLARVMLRFDRAAQFAESIDEVLAALRPALLAQRDRNHESEARIFSAVIQEGCASGAFDCEDAYTAAYCMLIATNSLLPYSLSAAQLGERAEIERKTIQISDLLIDGLAARSRTQEANLGR